ncbi:hypothetical protein ACHAXA_003341 [Cyclostephanos tholiformis]|uniref:Uncharacterized protein n=1 Tax=Cyclostephanos tholiformis TaxID=382380 RepID=A0ABD3RJP1_9STRA
MWPCLLSSLRCEINTLSIWKTSTAKLTSKARPAEPINCKCEQKERRDIQHELLQMSFEMSKLQGLTEIVHKLSSTEPYLRTARRPETRNRILPITSQGLHRTAQTVGSSLLHRSGGDKSNGGRKSGEHTTKYWLETSSVEE